MAFGLAYFSWFLAQFDSRRISLHTGLNPVGEQMMTSLWCRLPLPLVVFVACSCVSDARQRRVSPSTDSPSISLRDLRGFLGRPDPLPNSRVSLFLAQRRCSGTGCYNIWNQYCVEAESRVTTSSTNCHLFSCIPAIFQAAQFEADCVRMPAQPGLIPLMGNGVGRPNPQHRGFTSRISVVVLQRMMRQLPSVRQCQAQETLPVRCFSPSQRNLIHDAYRRYLETGMRHYSAFMSAFIPSLIPVVNQELAALTRTASEVVRRCSVPPPGSTLLAPEEYFLANECSLMTLPDATLSEVRGAYRERWNSQVRIRVRRQLDAQIREADSMLREEPTEETQAHISIVLGAISQVLSEHQSVLGTEAQGYRSDLVALQRRDRSRRNEVRRDEIGGRIRELLSEIRVITQSARSRESQDEARRLHSELSGLVETHRGLAGNDEDAGEDEGYEAVLRELQQWIDSNDEALARDELRMEEIGDLRMALCRAIESRSDVLAARNRMRRVDRATGTANLRARRQYAAVLIHLQDEQRSLRLALRRRGADFQISRDCSESEEY